MSEEIRFPDDLYRKFFGGAMVPGGAWYKDQMAAMQAAATWMREECAKVAADRAAHHLNAATNKDLTQDIRNACYADMTIIAAAIRRIGERVEDGPRPEEFEDCPKCGGGQDCYHLRQ